uniref:Peptidase C1A papain C-terminal domain-containing protein n=1 Tax=Ditylenchus dipsaci TaxID=166011 RepID=A0A915EK00_9BILA
MHSICAASIVFLLFHFCKGYEITADEVDVVERFSRKFNRSYSGEAGFRRQQLLLANYHQTGDFEELEDWADKHVRCSDLPFLVEDAERITLNETGVELPDHVDWRESNCVTPVFDQGNYGTCGFVSIAGAMECQYKLQAGLPNPVRLSAQELIDCGRFEQRSVILEHMMKEPILGGLTTESEYPYEGAMGECRYKEPMRRATIHRYALLRRSEESLKRAAFHEYKGGEVFKDSSCNYKSDMHAMVAVGYGTDPLRETTGLSRIVGTKTGVKRATSENERASIGYQSKAAGYPDENCDWRHTRSILTGPSALQKKKRYESNAFWRLNANKFADWTDEMRSILHADKEVIVDDSERVEVEEFLASRPKNQ